MKSKLLNTTIIFCCSTIITLVSSCNQAEDIPLDEHQSVYYKIDPSHQSNPLSLAEYNVDSVCSLSFSQTKNEPEISKILVKNNRIYIMDSRINRTVFVFDNTGKYLFKVGERGRAKHEYPNAPTDFFVDNMNNIHVFDQVGQKVISFNKYGKVFRVVVTGGHFPHSFGLTSDNRYAYCRSDKSTDGKQPALMFCDWNSENPKKVLPMNESCVYRPSDRTFFSNEKLLSHIPILSDSVLVFQNDSLEKVVHFDFGGHFLKKEHPEYLTSLEAAAAVGKYSGVWSLLEYQETKDLAYLEYIYQSNGRRWLYNKHTKKAITSTGLFDGVYPFSKYFLRDNQIITLVDQNTVNELKEFIDNPEFKSNLSKSAPEVRAIFEGKIKVPAIFYISLK